MLRSSLIKRGYQCQRTILCQYSSTPQPNAPSASQSATSAAQPLSTPNTPAPPATKSKREKAVKSICEAGTVFKGLNIMKSGTDPVAKAESEYPPYLWTILQDTSVPGDKKDVRKVNRATIKRKNFFSGKL